MGGHFQADSRKAVNSPVASKGTTLRWSFGIPLTLSSVMILINAGCLGYAMMNWSGSFEILISTLLAALSEVISFKFMGHDIQIKVYVYWTTVHSHLGKASNAH